LSLGGSSPAPLAGSSAQRSPSPSAGSSAQRRWQQPRQSGKTSNTCNASGVVFDQNSSNWPEARPSHTCVHLSHSAMLLTAWALGRLDCAIALMQPRQRRDQGRARPSLSPEPPLRGRPPAARPSAQRPRSCSRPGHPPCPGRSTREGMATLRRMQQQRPGICMRGGRVRGERWQRHKRRPDCLQRLRPCGEPGLAVGQVAVRSVLAVPVRGVYQRQQRLQRRQRDDDGGMQRRQLAPSGGAAWPLRDMHS
jgi:hypothetical protein